MRVLINAEVITSLGLAFSLSCSLEGAKEEEKPQFRGDILTALYSFLREESFVCHLGNGPWGMKSAWISTVV